MTIQEALSIKEKCDPTDCDCDTCPIGQPVEYLLAESGVYLKTPICSLLLWLEDIMENEKQ